MEIGKTYTLFDLVCLKAEISYNTTMSTEQPNSITIRNGQLDSAKLSVLEGLELSADLKQKYIEPLKSLGLSVSNGLLTVELSDLSLNRFCLSITVSSDDIDVADGEKTTVSVTLKYTIFPVDEIREKFEEAVSKSAQAVEESLLLLAGAFISSFEEYKDVIVTYGICILFILGFLGGVVLIFA